VLIHNLKTFRVAVPLSDRSLNVVAPSGLAAVKAALQDTGLDEGRSVTEIKRGTGWMFYEIKPPLPRTWLGEAPVAPNVTNPTEHLNIIEVEVHGSTLVYLEPEEIPDE